MKLHMTTASGIDLVKKEDAESDIAKLVELLDTIEEMCGYTNAAENIKKAINKHKKETPPEQG